MGINFQLSSTFDNALVDGYYEELQWLSRNSLLYILDAMQLLELFNPIPFLVQSTLFSPPKFNKFIDFEVECTSWFVSITSLDNHKEMSFIVNPI